jgi:uncharacterized membrane protein
LLVVEPIFLITQNYLMNQKIGKISFLVITFMIVIACSKSDSTPTQTNNGPLFTAVKAIVAGNCASCHTGATANGGMDLSTDPKIESAKLRIKARAVDGTPSFMPQGGQLTTAEKQAITNWINAGGRTTD